MKITSKIFSIVLALIMALSIFVLPTSAADDLTADVKFRMEKNTEQSTDDYDVYTVTASVKAGNNGIAGLTMAVVYDKTVLTSASQNAKGTTKKYTVAPTTSGSYKYPAYKNLGEFSADMEEKYFYSEDGVKGYEADDTYWITPALGATIEYTVSQAAMLGTLDTSKYGANTYVFEGGADVAYMNANGEYVDFAEFYFFAPAGTEVEGKSLVGTFAGAKVPEVSFDSTGSFYYAGGLTKLGTVNVTNAVGPADSIVSAKRQQIRFNEDGSAFDYRFVAEISAADFESYFSSDIPTACSKIKDIGFVFASTDNVADFNMATAKALVEKGTAASGYLKKECKYISQSFSTNTDGEEVTEDVEGFVFSCVVTGITDSEANAYALAYMAFDSNGDGVNEYVYYPVATYATFSTLYDYYYPVAILGL